MSDLLPKPLTVTTVVTQRESTTNRTGFPYYPYGYDIIPTNASSVHQYVPGDLRSFHSPSFSTSRLALATVAVGAGLRGGLVPARLKAQPLDVQTHGHQHLHQGHLLLGGPVHQGGAGGVALGPHAGVHQVVGTAPGGGSVAVGVLEAPVPALQRAGQRRAFHLEVNPVTGIEVWKENTTAMHQSGPATSHDCEYTNKTPQYSYKVCSLLL